MKKIAIVLLLVLLVTPLAFAQAKKTATKAASEPEGFVGVSLNQIPCNPFTAPSARFGFGNWSLDAGGALINTAAGTQITLYGKAEIPISKPASNVKTYWAPTLCLLSPAGGGNSTINISVLLGAEYMFTSNLALFADMTAIAINSVGGTTTWMIGSNSGTIYSGGRLYF